MISKISFTGCILPPKTRGNPNGTNNIGLDFYKSNNVFGKVNQSKKNTDELAHVFWTLA